MILAADLKSAFEIVIDEVQTGYFDGEVDDFLSQAQMYWFHRWVFPTVMNPISRPERVAHLENSKYNAVAISPFIEAQSGVSDNNGIVSTLISNAQGSELYALSAVTAGISGYHTEKMAVRYRTRGEAVAQAKDSFYSPSPNTISYSIHKGEVHFHPKVKMDYAWDALFSPAPIVQGTTDSQFLDVYKDHLVYKAVELASIAVRDESMADRMAQKIADL